jgi:hypothetical protein
VVESLTRPLREEEWRYFPTFVQQNKNLAPELTYFCTP